MKLKIHNVSQRRQRINEPQVTCTRTVKFGRAVFELQYVSRQTNRHTHHNTSQPYWPLAGRSKYMHF